MTTSPSNKFGHSSRSGDGGVESIPADGRPASFDEQRVPGGLRIALRTQGRVSSAGADGAWWPRSRTLGIEAADLVDHYPNEDRIYRLLFSPPDWDDGVVDGHGLRRVRCGRGPVKVGSFPRDDTQLMILTMTSGRRIRLQVIPADTAPGDARRALQAMVA